MVNYTQKYKILDYLSSLLLQGLVGHKGFEVSPFSATSSLFIPEICPVV